MVRICLLLTLTMVYVAAEQEYLVDVVTADEDRAATPNARVAIKLKGNRATSKWMRLVNNPDGHADLKHGSTKFTVSTELYLGNLHSIELRYRDWGWWKLNNIIVTETKSKQTWKFPYLEWLRQPQTLSLRSSSSMSGQNGYEGRCTETKECSSSLSCIDGGCLCHHHEYHVYDDVHGDICRKRKHYYEWCTSTWECKSAYECRDRLCLCGSDEQYDYINGKCLKKIGYEGRCTETKECSLSLSCIDGGCFCHRHEDHVYDKVHGNICRKTKDYQHRCTYTWECKSGFECSDSVCLCGSDENYINGKCHKEKYGGPCEANFNCPRGMVCTDEKDSICACSANQYYDDKVGECHNKKDYHDVCTDTKECTSNFVCYDSVCICGPRKTYINGECHNRPCKNNGYCYQGMVCSKHGLCACPDNQYYDDNDGLCHKK